MMQNINNRKIYSDNFKIHVVELKQIHLATEGDKARGLDKWAALFKVKTWEELKAMAETNEYIAEAAQTMYVLSSDKRVIEQCRRRREVEQEHNYYVSTLAAQQAQIADLGNQLVDKDNQITDMGNQINELEAEIAALKAKLNINK
jgi:septal ring factor EnvC (AmiA/AmiB activator)